MTESNNEQFRRPFGLCSHDNSIFVIDQENRCIYKIDEELEQCELFVGKDNLEWFVDGCFDNVTLSSPTGICNRQLTIFICENPAAKQEAIRVFSLFNSLVAFKSIGTNLQELLACTRNGKGSVLKLPKRSVVKRSRRCWCIEEFTGSSKKA